MFGKYLRELISMKFNGNVPSSRDIYLVFVFVGLLFYYKQSTGIRIIEHFGNFSLKIFLAFHIATNFYSNANIFTKLLRCSRPVHSKWDGCPDRDLRLCLCCVYCWCQTWSDYSTFGRTIKWKTKQMDWKTKQLHKNNTSQSANAAF